MCVLFIGPYQNTGIYLLNVGSAGAWLFVELTVIQIPTSSNLRWVVAQGGKAQGCPPEEVEAPEQLLRPAFPTEGMAPRSRDGGGPIWGLAGTLGDPGVRTRAISLHCHRC